MLKAKGKNPIEGVQELGTYETIWTYEWEVTGERGKF
jgi:hypothetical protein